MQTFRLGVYVALLLLPACSASGADPVFESTSVSDVIVFGGDCAQERCVEVTGPVVGSQEGEGSCALFGPGDPDSLDPIAESGPLEMTPGEDAHWQIKLPSGAPPTSDLNPVCEPMLEG